MVQRRALLLGLSLCAFGGLVLAQSVSVSFLDEWGNETAQVLENGKVLLRVVDAAASGSPGPDSVTVGIASTEGGDSKPVTLTETGGSTGVFEGEIGLTTAFEPDRLYTRPFYFDPPPYTLDTVDASYGGATGSAEVVPTTVEILLGGRPAPALALGDTATLRVRDVDDDESPTSRETVEIVAVAGNGDQEPLRLTETGPHTGVFEGTLRIAGTGPPQYGDGAVHVLAGDTVEVRYDDDESYPPAWPSTDTAGVTARSVRFVDRQGRTAPIVLEGDRALLLVHDQAANADFLTRESVTATVTTQRSGDSETITLLETGPDTGAFEGSARVEASGYTPFHDNGMLETRSQAPDLYDGLDAIYGPVAATVTAAAGVRGSITELIDESGAEAPSYAFGQQVRVRVTDFSASGLSLHVEVRTLAGGDQETVSLHLADSGAHAFEASIPLWPGDAYPNDGYLFSQAGDTLEVRRQDVNGATGSRDTARVAGNAIEFLDDQGRSTSMLIEGAPARFRVFDMTLAGMPQVTAGFTSSIGSDSEQAAALQTAPLASTFEGSVPLTLASTGPQDGALTTGRAGYGFPRLDRVEGTYQSPYFGGSSVTAETVAGLLTFLDDAGDEAVSYPPRATVRLRLRSQHANNPAQVDSAVVWLRTPSNDQEQVSLHETGADTGVFEGSLPSDPDGYPWSYNGRVEIAPGTTLAASFSDAGYHPVRAEVPFVASSLDFVDAQGRPVGSYLAGEPVGLRVIRFFPFRDTDAPDTLTLELRTHRLDSADVDRETVRLTETGPDTLVFTASLTPVKSAPAVPEDGVLQLSSYAPYYGDHESLIATWGSVTDTASLRDSALQLVDAQGAVAETCVVEHPLHIRLVRPLSDQSDAPDSAYVTVYSLQTGDTESVTLTESGSRTGVFTGSLATAEWPGQDPWDGLLRVETGELVQAVFSLYGPLAVDFARIVNNSPAAQDDAASTGAGAAVDIDVLANDSDPDGHTISVNGWSNVSEQGGTVAKNADGTLRYTPPAGFTGADRFSYTVGDEFGGSDSAFVVVTVTRIEGPPDAVDDAATTAEETPVTIAVLANDSDPDGDPLSVASLTQPANGTATLGAGGAVSYAPDADFSGTDSFAYTVTAGTGTDTATVTVTVTAVNDPPEADDDTATTPEDMPVTIPVLANDRDADGDPLTVSFASDPNRGDVVTNADGTITYTPGADLSGGDLFVYDVRDPAGRTSRATVRVTVTAVQDPPVANHDAPSTPEDTPLTIDALANDRDPDGDALTIQSVSQPETGAATIAADGRIAYTPRANFFGLDRFNYTISDGQGNTSTNSIWVQVTSVNDLPDAVDDAAITNEDTAVAVSVLANDSDVETQALTVQSVTQPAHGTAAIGANNTVTYTPAAHYNGMDSFTYVLSDNAGGTDTATVSITIGAVNDAPDAINDSAATDEDVAVTISVLANDIDRDGENLVISAVTQGTRGSVSANANGTLTYAPSPNTFGTDSFTYTVRDAAGSTDTATVTMNVAAVNDPPTAAADTGSGVESTNVAIYVLANDSDVEGNALTLVSVGAPSHGTARTTTINGVPVVVYTPAANFTGVDTFPYTVGDGAATSAGTVTVTIRDAFYRVAVLGTNSVWLQTGADVLSGDVVVNRAGAGPFLNGGVELSIAGSVTTPAGWDVQADSVLLASGSTVASDLFHNQLTNDGVVTGPVTTPLPLPVFAALPAFQTATPGATDVSVSTNGTRFLSPGSYRDLIVGRKGTVFFYGGVFHFRSIRVDREAKLYFMEPAEVRVQQKMSTQLLVTVGPSGSNILASDIRFYVGGINGTGGGLAETPKAVEIGTDNVLSIGLYAANGTLWIKDRTQATGAFLARDVQVGPDVQVRLESAWSVP